MLLRLLKQIFMSEQSISKLKKLLNPLRDAIYQKEYSETTE